MALGKLIIFEGPDNCGKTTQLKLVSEEFARVVKEKGNNKIVTYKTFKFPRNNSFYGKLIYHMLYDNKKYALNTIKNINLLAQLQLDDKIEGLKELTNLLEEYDYIFLDRFTLSSRVYDAASYYFLYSKTDVSFLNADSKNSYGLDNFLQEWVFTEEFEYINESLRERFIYAYSILNHSYFDTKYVLFKSSPVLKRISNNERPPDQYESGAFGKFINIIYDKIASTALDNNKIENPIIVDTDAIIKDKIPFLGENNDVVYTICKSQDYLSRYVITKYIVEKLYETLKDK